MVTRYGSNLTRPEEKLADRVFKKFNLSVPVDVESLIERYAKLEIDSIPNNVDAIIINSENKTSQPIVIISNKLTQKRKRFTIAHELGHILIPWHIGTIFCHTDNDFKLNQNSYNEIEQEANRFASELLLNSDWIQNIFENNRIDLAFLKLRKSVVSDQAIVIKLRKLLPYKTTVILHDKSGKLISFATSISQVSEGFLSSDEAKNFFQSYTRYNLDSSMGNRITILQDSEFYSEKDNLNFAKTIEATEESKLILQRILKRTSLQSKINSVNGIIGAANNQFKKATDFQLFTIMYNRFKNKSELRIIYEDKEFEIFLRKKAKELRI